MVQGMTKQVLEFAGSIGFKDHQFAALAGNSMTVGVIGAFILAALVWALVEFENINEELNMGNVVADILNM